MGSITHKCRSQQSGCSLTKMCLNSFQKWPNFNRIILHLKSKNFQWRPRYWYRPFTVPKFASGWPTPILDMQITYTGKRSKQPKVWSLGNFSILSIKSTETVVWQTWLYTIVEVTVPLYVDYYHATLDTQTQPYTQNFDNTNDNYHSFQKHSHLELASIECANNFFLCAFNML